MNVDYHWISNKFYQSSIYKRLKQTDPGYLENVEAMTTNGKATCMLNILTSESEWEHALKEKK